MVEGTGFAPVIVGSEPTVILFHQPSSIVSPTRFELVSLVLQTKAITRCAKGRCCTRPAGDRVIFIFYSFVSPTKSDGGSARIRT